VAPAIGVGGAVSPLLAKQILHGDATFAGLAFAAVTFGSALAAVPISRVMSLEAVPGPAGFEHGGVRLLHR
jgi:hypothetical protein